MPEAAIAFNVITNYHHELYRAMYRNYSMQTLRSQVHRVFPEASLALQLAEVCLAAAVCFKQC
jgi:hypothetical protein